MDILSGFVWLTVGWTLVWLVWNVRRLSRSADDPESHICPSYSLVEMVQAEAHAAEREAKAASRRLTMLASALGYEWNGVDWQKKAALVAVTIRATVDPVAIDAIDAEVAYDAFAKILERDLPSLPAPATRKSARKRAPKKAAAR